MTQEERYYITNDVKIDANSLWIEKQKKNLMKNNIILITIKNKNFQEEVKKYKRKIY